MRNLTIDVGPADRVPLAFGYTDIPLEQWLDRCHSAGATTCRASGAASGAPVLLPLFDALDTSGPGAPAVPVPCRPPDGARDPLPAPGPSVALPALSRIRVTFPKGGGTVVGINISHVLGDGASAVRFAQCWGREHQGLPYRAPTTDRSRFTCNGMLTQSTAELMGLTAPPRPWALGWRAMRDARALGLPVPDPKALPPLQTFLRLLRRAQSAWCGAMPQQTSPPPSHRFVRLQFPSALLRAMKAHASRAPGFVSTNDLATAVGWLLMRELSGYIVPSLCIPKSLWPRICRGRGVLLLSGGSPSGGRWTTTASRSCTQALRPFWGVGRLIGSEPIVGTRSEAEHP